jgi:5'-phosphate synthase pdxT subunit
LLAESANRTKKGGQELIGGLDVRVNRNHFGRQTESFQAPLYLPFLDPAENSSSGMSSQPFTGIFIRAPVVEKVLPTVEGIQTEEQKREETVVAPTRQSGAIGDDVEILAKLPGRAARLTESGVSIAAEKDAGDIIAVRQGNVFGTSFHPELMTDSRIHEWWLRQIEAAVEKSNSI